MGDSPLESVGLISASGVSIETAFEKGGEPALTSNPNLSALFADTLPGAQWWQIISLGLEGDPKL